MDTVRRYSMLIDGDWIDTDDRFEVRSPHTPLTLLEFAKIATECGLPPGVRNVVPGDGPVVGARLASHPDVRKIAFTGSTAVGREIMRMAAGNVKRLTLELGGKGPNIVLDDADLDLAADGTLFACLMNQGQACESGTRAIVASSVHDKFVERLIERAATIRIGDPLDPATDFGPGRKAPMTLEGKTLFISGGSRGIGLAIAIRAARDGANVALIAKTAEPHPKLEGTVYTAAAQIEAAGGRALPVVGDIRDEAQVAAAVAQAAERFGGIDVCVNNASAINLSGTEALDFDRYAYRPGAQPAALRSSRWYEASNRV